MFARPPARLIGGLFAGAALASTAAGPVHAAETYVFDASHTHIGFAVSHFGFSAVRGHFTSFDGTLSLDQENLANSEISVTVDTTSIDTGWADRDEHLVSSDFFAVEEFPQATFVSTDVAQTGENTLEVTGDFTLLGETHPLTLNVTVNRIGPHPFDDSITVAGFQATGTLQRSTFGMDYAMASEDDPSTGVGDEVTLIIEAEMSSQ